MWQLFLLKLLPDHNLVYGSKINDWLESRIIHIGKHDKEENGITFQSIHALPNKVAYDSAYTGSGDYTGNWETSTLRSYLNDTFKATLPSSLSGSLVTATKLSNKTAGEHPIAGKDAIRTQDQLCILSFTEFVKNAEQNLVPTGVQALIHMMVLPINFGTKRT